MSRQTDTSTEVSWRDVGSDSPIFVTKSSGNLVDLHPLLVLLRVVPSRHINRLCPGREVSGEGAAHGRKTSNHFQNPSPDLIDKTWGPFDTLEALDAAFCSLH
jgi:hypothetical protein